LKTLKKRILKIATTPAVVRFGYKHFLFSLQEIARQRSRRKFRNGNLRRGKKTNV